MDGSKKEKENWILKKKKDVFPNYGFSIHGVNKLWITNIQKLLCLHQICAFLVITLQTTSKDNHLRNIYFVLGIIRNLKLFEVDGMMFAGYIEYHGMGGLRTFMYYD